jgi:hypothetical protein
LTPPRRVLGLTGHAHCEDEAKPRCGLIASSSKQITSGSVS